MGDVVEYTHAARIFEYRRAIAVAELAGVGAHRGDFYVLGPGRRGKATRQHQRR